MSILLRRQQWLSSFFICFLVSIYVQLSSANYYHYHVDHHQNPYSQQQPEQISPESIVSNNDTFILRKWNRKPSSEWTFVNQTQNPGGTRRQILVGHSLRPLNESSSSSLLVSATSNIQPVIQHPAHFQNFGQRQPLLEQSSSYLSQESIDTQQPNALPYYQCDSVIQDQHFIIESPNYPAQYPINQICSYYISKNRSDVCQVEVTISDMDIEDTAQCTADYVDFGPSINSNNQQQERLCGLMLRNTRRFINFPSNATHIRITFHSDGKNDRPYRGFSAEVQQIPNSCNYSTAYPNTGGGGGGGGQTQQYPISTGVSGGIPPYPSDYVNPARGFKYPGQPGYPGYPPKANYPGKGQQPGYQPGTPIGAQYPTGGTYGRGFPSSGGINTGYGQRLYPPQHPPYYQRPNMPTVPGQVPISGPGSGSFGGSMGPNVQVYDGQVPNAGSYGNNVGGIGTGYPSTINRTNTPIYLASYCDVYLGEFNGEIRSPNYPFGYPTNHSCVYTIKKASDDVCQVELIFHHFDIQTPNAQKDLTDNCHGDYLQMPDGGRLCGYYTQSMSGDYKLKKYYAFPETSEYIFMNFFSDGHQTPDGSGFWLEVKQLPNTCKPGFDYRGAKCDRIITGQYSEVERIYSPNYPQFYGPRQQCSYFVQPMDSKTCEFELDLVQFSLEQPTKQDNEECRKDFLQLPDRNRICGQHKFRRIFQFPKYHERTAMFYFQSDDQIEDRGFEIVVRQIPNSCGNYSQQQMPGGMMPGAGGPQQGPWNTNVYVQDPNIGSGTAGGQPYFPPTPVFTYDNSSGLQPYHPPIRPPGRSFGPTDRYGPGYSPSPYVPYGSSGAGINPSTFGRKSAMLPTYWTNPDLPNALNDPKNVDSTGTIPLYFANGTLATRIPPMKPVDMIPFLKKGKTIQQKGSMGRAFAVSSINDMTAIANNRYPHIRSSSTESESEIFQSSARLKEDNDDQGSSRAIAAGPAYNCDQTITRPVEYIRSPNFPSNYPVVSRCIYSIIKSDNSVCQIRLHILQLDLEYTSGCKNDYLLIESTGEKLCGRINQPQVHSLNYYGYSRDIRLIFNSDRQNTRSGFEVRIEQVPSSCDELKPNQTWNSMIGGAAAARNLPDPLVGTSNKHNDPNSPLENLRMAPSSISAQALTNSNQTNTVSPSIMITTLMPQTQQRVCSTTSVMESYFESENFPLEYPSNVNCLYKIFRANKNVCRLEIAFEEFNVGDETIFDSEMIKPNSKRSIGECLNDFLEIDGTRYCGQRRGQQVAINFPKILNEIQFRFFSVISTSTGKFNGFRIKVKQIDENCRSSTNSISNELDDNSGLEIEDFSPAIIESCPKLGSSSNNNNNNSTSSTIIGFGPLVLMDSSSLSNIDPSSTISEEIVKIQSPQFGLPSNIEYEPFLDCYYVIQKANRNICSLEIKFEIFTLEESQECKKDFLEINGMRYCGKLPMDTIKVFEFFEERKLIHFHTDSDQNDQGFAMILKQIRC